MSLQNVIIIILLIILTITLPTDIYMEYNSSSETDKMKVKPSGKFSLVG